MADFVSRYIDPRTTVLGGHSGLGNFFSEETKGVYSDTPAAQLKYYTDWQNGQKTQARMWVSVVGQSQDRFLTKLKHAVGLDNDEVVAYATAITNPNGYIDFILSNVSEGRQEKVQVVDLLSDSYVAYFFGRRPETFSYSGTLLNTQQDDWWRAFTLLYDSILRGTKLAEYGLLAHIRYDDRVVSGAITDFASSMGADQQMAAGFNFNMLVKQVTFLPPAKGSARVPTPTIPADSFAGDFDLSRFETALNVNSLGATAVIGSVSETRRVDPAKTVLSPQQQTAAETKPKLSATNVAASVDTQQGIEPVVIGWQQPTK